MAAVEADAVIVDLEARLGEYKANMLEAIALQQRYQKGWTAPANDTSAQDATQRSSSAKKAAGDAVAAEEQATAGVTRARKARTAAVKQAASEEVSAEKAAADAKLAVARGLAAEQDRLATQQLTARRRARLQELQDARQAPAAEPQRPTIYDRSASNPQRTGPLRPAGDGDLSRGGSPLFIPSSALAGDAEVASEKEVNALLLEQASLRAGASAGDQASAAFAKERMTYLNLYNSALRANLSEEDATAFAEERILAIQKARFEQALKQVAVQRSQSDGQTSSGKDVARFAEGAGLGRSFGSVATVGGIAAAAGVGIGVEAVKSATDYAKALQEVSHQAGITAENLQVYQHAAIDAGAKSTDFDAGLLHLADSLGKARTGATEQSKVFAALGVNIKSGASAGELLPTLVNRITSISDQSQRAAVEMALFGESGEKLDGLLSGGTEKINELAQALKDTGSILSSADIARLDDVSKKLAAVKAQLAVDLAEVVAGNADAIEGLAKSFAQLANDIFQAINALDQYAKTSATGKFLANPVAAGGQVRDFLNTQTNKLLTAVGIPGFEPSVAPAAAASAAPPVGKVQRGAVDPAALARLNAPKGPKGANPNTALNEADERTKRFNDIMARYQSEQEAAVAQQTSDEAERAEQQRAKIQRDAAKDIADLQTQAKIDARKKGADEALIQSRLAQATSARQAVAIEQTNVVNLQENLASIRRETAARTASLSFTNELLADGQRSTDTSAERQRVALETLANEQKIKELSAQEVLRRAAQGDPTVTKQDIDTANTTLTRLPAETAAKAGQIKDQTRSPGQVYADSLRTNSDTVQDSEVNTLKQFNSELDKSVEKTLHLHGILGSIVDDLIDMAVKQALIKPLAGALFGGGGSTGGSGGGLGGIGSLLGGIGKIFGGGGSGPSIDVAGNEAGANSAISSILKALPLGFASGGAGVIGGNPGVDQNVLSINGNPVAKVGAGELLSVTPNIGSANGRAAPAAGTVMHLSQTINVDGRNSVTPGDFAQQIISVSADHANKVARQAGAQAVNASPARVQRQQTLGN